ncbi:MAG: hypothetical protein ACLFVK_01430 [Dehalococcoidia bacterium]
MTNKSGLRGFLSGRLGRLTVAVMVLGFTVFVALFVAWLTLGEGTWRGEVSVANAELRSPDRLALIVCSCNGDPEVSLLRETEVDVQVKVVASSSPLRGGGDCLDVVEVQLQEPLGDRVVVDKHTGQSVSVSYRHTPVN